MTTKLQDAILATRNGDTVGAQKLLADILKADTEHVQAWYLLALLVDSPEKKQAYLNRVLTLDPQHEKASEALSNMEPLMVSSPQGNFEDPSLFDLQDEDSIIPSWLEEDGTEVSSDMLIEEDPSEIFLPSMLESDSPVDILEEPPTLVTAPILQESLLKEDAGAAVKETATAQSLEQEYSQYNTLSEHQSPPLAQGSLQRLNLALMVLSLFAIIVFIVLIAMISA